MLHLSVFNPLAVECSVPTHYLRHGTWRYLRSDNLSNFQFDGRSYHPSGTYSASSPIWGAITPLPYCPPDGHDFGTPIRTSPTVVVHIICRSRPVYACDYQSLERSDVGIAPYDKTVYTCDYEGFSNLYK